MKKALIVIGMMLTGCLAQAAGYNSDTTGTDKKMGKPVAFRLADYKATDSIAMQPYRDTALMALELLSKVFSSKAFRDSLAHYTFPCSNGKKAPCLLHPRLEPRKCDSTAGLIHGATVYHDLTVDSVVSLSLFLKTAVTKTKTIGFSSGCKYTITTYDWFMKSRANLVESYAVHLAHEYCHVVGYVHNKKMHGKKEDVAYRIGGIVRNIIHQKEGAL